MRAIVSTTHAYEIDSGKRFGFGKNWASFLRSVTEERIVEAEQSLRKMLQLESLEGLSFLDLGCGSGLFSLAARRLGARVTSFDFDPRSVACAMQLKTTYSLTEDHWKILEGSILDHDFASSLGAFDVVYSWGVLHHTGSLWKACAEASGLVRRGGHLYIALYNEQGWRSDAWKLVKRAYCANKVGRAAVLGLFVPQFALKGLVYDCVYRRNPIGRYRNYKTNRGMSVVHDWVDWLGGYPFETAPAGEVFEFFRQRGFALKRLRTTSGLGNNEFLFQKE